MDEKFDYAPHFLLSYVPVLGFAKSNYGKQLFFAIDGFHPVLNVLVHLLYIIRLPFITVALFFGDGPTHDRLDLTYWNHSGLVNENLVRSQFYAFLGVLCCEKWY